MKEKRPQDVLFEFPALAVPDETVQDREEESDHENDESESDELCSQ